jgi:hypothetical protein
MKNISKDPLNGKIIDSYCWDRDPSTASLFQELLLCASDD